MTRVIYALAFLCFIGTKAVSMSETVRVNGYVGAHELELAAYKIVSARTFKVSGKPDYIGITEVYPDTTEPVVYRYTVEAAGICPYERAFKSVGFGRVTYFIEAGVVPVTEVRITRRSANGEQWPVLISSVFGVSDSELQALKKHDSFPIMGLLPTTDAKERDRLAAMLKAGIPEMADYGITAGFSSEIRYASQDAKQVEDEIKNCADIAARHGMRALLGPVSWWVGTPRFVEDGEGGTFGGVKYQQVCYSPDREFAYDARLADLLGSRYNRHYKLSVPNRWSNTPWLTMNSKALNDYRFRRLDECVRILKEACKGDESWVAGIFLENEPRYWDTHCEALPVGSGAYSLWADFNPFAVRAAAEQGIDLNPEDGLSSDELAWLHRNVGEYNQDTVDAYVRSAAQHSFGAGIPVYTHSLQHRWMFPGAEINHPASEWAFANAARTGLEGMFTMPSDFYRVRDWGYWTNLNREENDGADIDLHLWDLRVSYAMGADFYNSYNWHAIGPERFFAYVREFVSSLPAAKASPAALRAADRYTFRMRTPMKLQAFTKLTFPVCSDAPVKGSACVAIMSPGGESFSSECQMIDLPRRDSTLSFTFTTPAECSWQDDVQVTLYVFDESGRMALQELSLGVKSPSDVELELDLAAQRALSRVAIKRAELSRRGS